jgi:hypothetical protein
MSAGTRRPDTGVLEAAARGWLRPEPNESAVDCLKVAITESETHTLRLRMILSHVQEQGKVGDIAKNEHNT